MKEVADNESLGEHLIELYCHINMLVPVIVQFFWIYHENICNLYEKKIRLQLDFPFLFNEYL